MSMYGEELYGGGLYGGSDDEGATAWITIAGAIVDCVAAGPAFYTDADGNVVSAPGVFVQPLTLKLVDESALGVVLSTLDEAFAQSFIDEANDVGSASWSYQATDTTIASILTEDQLVNFFVYGNIAFTQLIEQRHKISRTAGEEHDQIVVVNGRGHLALWERAVLYPSRGVDSLPIEEDRVFNWTSAVYDDTGWGFAKQILIQSSATPPWGANDAPNEWPDPTAYWIWHSSGTTQFAEPGISYFRREFIVPAGCTRIRLYYAFDNRGRILIDGVPIAEQDGSHFDWLNTKFVEVEVTPGPHLIAVEGINDPPTGVGADPSPATHTVVSGDTLWGIAQRYYGDGRSWPVIYDANQAQIEADAIANGLWNPYAPGHWIFPGQVFVIPGLSFASGIINPAGVIASVYALTNELASTLLVHTDSSWRCVGYPPDPPGMTPGEAIRLAKREATDRDNATIDAMELMFTDAVDSGGNAWPVVADIASKVGYTYLTFLLELTAKYIDLWMAPGTMKLYAWNKGTRNALRVVSLHGPTDPEDPDSGTVYDLAHTRIV